jgi:hypothetical protein
MLAVIAGHRAFQMAAAPTDNLVEPVEPAGDELWCRTRDPGGQAHAAAGRFADNDVCVTMPGRGGEMRCDRPRDRHRPVHDSAAQLPGEQDRLCSR